MGLLIVTYAYLELNIAKRTFIFSNFCEHPSKLYKQVAIGLDSSITLSTHKVKIFPFQIFQQTAPTPDKHSLQATAKYEFLIMAILCNLALAVMLVTYPGHHAKLLNKSSQIPQHPCTLVLYHHNITQT